MNRYTRFLDIVDQIERTYPVTAWQIGDVPVWPLARVTLYSNLYPENIHLRQQPGSRYASIARLGRAARYAATPLVNAWRSRGDLRNMVIFPRRAHAVFYGDGAWLDQVDGAWRDRICDPLISELHKQGLSTFLMQRGELRHLPWHRPTFAANTITNFARLSAAGLGLSKRLVTRLPDYEGVMEFLHATGVPADGMRRSELQDSAAMVATTAFGFEQLLKRVRPSICFMVTYCWGMGHALALACRRQGILSVELQREGRRHEAYCWSVIPERGYAVLPAVFWCWTQEEAAAIDVWSNSLKLPWHRGLHGGHPQMFPWFDDNDRQTRETDAEIDAIRSRAPADVEILVAFQDVGGHEHVLKDLAALIESSPLRWRWWLRRHPRIPTGGDGGVGRILAIRRPNVLIDEPSRLALPALLRHMDVLLSLTSGASVEASMFGVKPIFLSSDAFSMFPHLFETGKAEVIEDMRPLKVRLGRITHAPKVRTVQPAMCDSFSRLHAMAAEYRKLCSVH